MPCKNNEKKYEIPRIEKSSGNQSYCFKDWHRSVQKHIPITVCLKIYEPEIID